MFTRQWTDTVFPGFVSCCVVVAATDAANTTTTTTTTTLLVVAVVLLCSTYSDQINQHVNCLSVRMKSKKNYAAKVRDQMIQQW